VGCRVIECERGGERRGVVEERKGRRCRRTRQVLGMSLPDKTDRRHWLPHTSTLQPC
jgi:hypothetical protein